MHSRSTLSIIVFHLLLINYSRNQHYLDQASLQDECEEGRKLGFDAKQMIHPAQIPVVQAAFSPSAEGERKLRLQSHGLALTQLAVAIEKAQRVLAQYDAATKDGKGAYGLAAHKDAKAEMIDAPMILQAQRVISKAKQYGLA